MTKLPFDEITEMARASITEGSLEVMSNEEIEDEIEDLVIMAYTLGWGLFLTDYEVDTPLNQKLIYDALQTKLGGKTYKEYLEPHIEEKDIEGIYRVIDTTVHQMYVMAQENCAHESGFKTKTWRTMEDEKVRDTHRYLEGVTVPIDEKFYTYDGDSAPCPSLFSLPENNCNCRCVLHYD